MSSADAHVGDTVDFEVLEEVRVGDLLVIPRGGVAWGTVTVAEHKKRIARGGKLDMNVDAVRLVSGEKAALRAVKGGEGGGHTGAMTAGIVATGLLFFPAAPFFLFMHGKDVTIPKGAEITAYTNGNFPLDLAKFASPKMPEPASTSAATAQATMQIESVPSGADIELDGAFAGNTPSSLGIATGEHTIKITKAGYKPWERKIRISTGAVKLAAELEKQEALQPAAEAK
ncbi:MAG TPA: PEGA domain-containing protein [Terriglobales bacterium]|nr:PEGA domain-containing protein [Terriglobales bacterium]